MSSKKRDEKTSSREKRRHREAPRKRTYSVSPSPPRSSRRKDRKRKDRGEKLSSKSRTKTKSEDKEKDRRKKERKSSPKRDEIVSSHERRKGHSYERSGDRRSSKKRRRSPSPKSSSRRSRDQETKVRESNRFSDSEPEENENDEDVDMNEFGGKTDSSSFVKHEAEMKIKREEEMTDGSEGGRGREGGGMSIDVVQEQLLKAKLRLQEARLRQEQAGKSAPFVPTEPPRASSSSSSSFRSAEPKGSSSSSAVTVKTESEKEAPRVWTAKSRAPFAMLPPKVEHVGSAGSQNGTGERRRKRWDNVTPSSRAAAESLRNSAAAKMKEAAAYQQQIQKTIESMQQSNILSGLSSAGTRSLATMKPHPGFVPAPLLLDDQGRPIDVHGSLIEEEKEKKPQQPISMFEKKEERISAKIDPSLKYFDPDLSLTLNQEDPLARKSRNFRFVKPGNYERRGAQMRAERLSLDLENQSDDEEMEEEDATNPNDIQLLNDASVELIPEVEWWDLDLLKGSQYDKNYQYVMVTHLIEHPIPLKEAVPDPEIASMPLFLTKKEKEKIRRVQNREKQDVKTDRIRLGIDEPPEPRLKPSNMVRVLGNNAFLDPSAVEKTAQAQALKRKVKHLLHNAERELTPVQKRLKRREKLKEDTSKEVHVALFRVEDLNDPQKRFKVDVHAQQYNLTGCCIIHPRCNLVLVEGGPKGIAKYNHLMLNRIDWEQKLMDDEEESDDEYPVAKKKLCSLVWKGVVLDRAFKSFVIERCKSENTARKLLAARGVVHYWETAMSHNPNEL